VRATVVAMVFVVGFVSGQIAAAQKPSPPAVPAERVTGIGGIFIKARNPTVLAAWYSDNLGVPRAEGPIPPLFRWRDHEDPTRAGTTVWGLFRADTKYFAPSTAPFMINYRVNELERLLARLRTAGITVEPKVVDDFNGKFGWVMDPEGNKIELWEPKPGF
jgi:catechol 2,3-dioxygenase-like lactoylglutathione lyase family enzyme